MRRILVVAGLVLIGLGLALYFSLSRTEVSRTLSQGEPVHLLWAIRLFPKSPPDLGVAITLLPRGAVFFLLIPGSLALPTKDGWSTLSAVYSAEGLAGWALRLAALLEFPHLRAMEVGPADWDKMVEAVGGVVVRLEERLVHQEEGQGITVDLRAGENLVFGETSRNFLAYAARHPGNPRFPLLVSFFQDLVARLWARGRAMLSVLQLDKSWETREFWRRALALPEERVGVEVLPLAWEDSRVMPDFVLTRKLREMIVSGRIFLTRDEVRVVVLNGTRERFLATRTAGWLSARGFRVVGVGTADRFDYAKTFLVVGPGAEEKAELLRRILPHEVVLTTAQAFGVERLGGWPKEADLVLVVGAGFDVGS